MAYLADLNKRYEYKNPDEGIIVEICRSFVIDYCKAIHKGDQEKADKIEYEFRHCYWLKYITEEPDYLVNLMLQEGDRQYGKKKKTRRNS